MHHRKLLISAGLFLAAIGPQATLVPSFASEHDSDPVAYYHYSDTDPEIEGWQLTENLTQSSEGSQADFDLNFRIPVWEIDSSRRYAYFHLDTPEPGVLGEPGDSWTLTTRFRIPYKSTPLSFNVVAGVDYGYTDENNTTDNRYIFAAGTNSNSETLLRFQNDENFRVDVPAAFVNGSPSTDYVTVVLAHDGMDMDVYVNGVQEFENLAGILSPQNRVQFGDGQTSGDRVQSYWSEVSFSIGPQACSDGIDNDGDGNIDFGDDTDCSHPTDPTEGETCVPGQHRRSVTQNPQTPEWYLLTLPCAFPPHATFADLFDDQVLLDSEWAAYTYDAAIGDYVEITANSPAPPPGTGFWFISTKSVELIIPQGSYMANREFTVLCDQEPCHRQSIEQQSDWHLLGNPTTENVLYTEMLVSNESTSCNEGLESCSVAEPTDPGIQSAMFVYDNFSGAYRLVDETQQLVKPWDGYWVIFVYDEELLDPWQLYSVPYPSQIAFVTDDSFTGNLGGTEGAESICQLAAESADLPGRYRPWLSELQTLFDPDLIFFQPDTPYIRVDGALVANDWNDLVSGSIQNPIHTTPTLNIADDVRVWTNTNGSGVGMFNSDCSAWVDESPFRRGRVGSTSEINGGWTSFESLSCDAVARLYCFGQ